MRPGQTFFIAVALAAAASGDAAAESKKAWDLDVSAGVKYDDRVTAENDENDVSVASSDYAAVFGVDAEYRLVDSDDSRVEIGYEFGQSLYQDLNEFDYQRHNPTLSAWTKTGGVKLGLNYSYTHATLGGDFFLDQHLLTPSISGYVDDDVQVTLFYRYYDKNYDDNNLDAQTHQPGADVQFFFNKSHKGYFLVGGAYTSEDTTGPEFDYTGPTLRATLQLPIEPFGKDGKLRLSYTYQMRDYENVTASIATEREDDRQTLRAYGEVEITNDLKATAEYRFTDRSSNLPSADYSKNVVSLGLEYGF